MDSRCRLSLYSAMGGLLIVCTAHAQSTEAVGTTAEATDSTLSYAQLPASSSTAATTEAAAAASGGLQEVVVTARKREESVLTVPTSITAFTTASLDALNIKTTTDYAIQTPNLAFSYGNAGLAYGGTRSLAIRGISGEGTTGVYIDDTPVPDTIDPRIIDLDRVEVLRGPQGTLFGESSLGGNVRMITTPPSPTDRDVLLEAYAGATKDGPDPNGGLAFAGNQDLTDTLTVRLNAFTDHASGFITRTWPAPAGTVSSQNDQGANSDYGASLAFLWSPLQALSITARLMFQNTDTYGWPAPYAPLTCFCIQSFTMNNLANVQNVSNDRWYLPSVTINYRGNGFTLTSSTSYFNRQVTNIDDATNGLSWAFDYIYGGGFPSLYQPGEGLVSYGDNIEEITTNETRISFDPKHGVSGTVGIFVSQDQKPESIDVEANVPGVAAGGFTTLPGYCSPGAPPCPSYGSNTIWYSNYPSTQTSEALFGELYYDWRMLELTVGLRAARVSLKETLTEEGAELYGYEYENLGTTTQDSVVPKFALSAKVTPESMVYASASEGFRAGGINQILPPLCTDLAPLGLTDTKPSTFKSDTVWDYEVGGKSQFDGNRMIVTGSLFYMAWDKIQQSFDVPTCFLSVILNEGAAIARGGEIEFEGRPLDQLQIRAGYGYDDARYSKQSLPGLPTVGTRVAIIPLASFNMSATYTQPLAGMLTGFVTGEVSHVGDSTSYDISPIVPLIRAPYTIVNASFGVRWDTSSKYHSELALDIRNLTDQRPNLGDLGDLEFPAHAGTGPNAPLLPVVVTLPPLTANLQYRLRF